MGSPPPPPFLKIPEPTHFQDKIFLLFAWIINTAIITINTIKITTMLITSYHRTKNLIEESIQKQLDARNNPIGVFVDLKKAFNTVDHNILLEKLDYYIV